MINDWIPHIIDIKLVNLDCSPVQLSASNDFGVTNIQASIDAFKREDVCQTDHNFLYVMRSVLHSGASST